MSDTDTLTGKPSGKGWRSRLSRALLATDDDVSRAHKEGISPAADKYRVQQGHTVAASLGRTAAGRAAIEQAVAGDVPGALHGRDHEALEVAFRATGRPPRVERADTGEVRVIAVRAPEDEGQIVEVDVQGAEDAPEAGE